MDINNPKLHRLLDYWVSKKPADALPGRQHIDPLEIPDLLAALFLIDVVRQVGGPRFHFRLMGSDFVSTLGRDFTGQWLDEAAPPESRQALVDGYIAMLETREPAYRRSHLYAYGREHINYERLTCPLARDGKTVDMLIGVIDFDRS